MYKDEIANLFEKNIIMNNEMIREKLKIEPKHYAMVNTEIKRMCDDDFIRRIGHGIYVRPKQTKWGKVLPTEMEIANTFYMDNGEGYLSGAAYYNAVGISTLVPNKKEITTNKASCRIKGLNHIDLVKPRLVITKKNRKYLQLLDGIYKLEKNHCDVEPQKVFAEIIAKEKLDEIGLLLLTKKYYPRYVLDYLLQILEVIHHDEFTFK